MRIYNPPYCLQGVESVTYVKAKFVCITHVKAKVVCVCVCIAYVKAEVAICILRCIIRPAQFESANKRNRESQDKRVGARSA
jgi:hypothetical protein